MVEKPNPVQITEKFRIFRLKIQDHPPSTVVELIEKRQQPNYCVCHELTADGQLEKDLTGGTLVRRGPRTKHLFQLGSVCPPVRQLYESAQVPILGPEQSGCNTSGPMSREIASGP